ncbi:MAG TPA: hypothetical protein DCQ93_04505 [Bacteroidetes bacterium]|nr:hypothetical protein [Bacteroidota bacterium]
MKKCFYIYFLFGCVIFFLAESCQPKGCTGKNALNFNSIARKKDGSCIYCDSIAKISGVDSIDLIDDNSASTHFNQVVARFYFTQTTKKFNDRGCGSDSCLIFYRIKNLTVNNIDLYNFIQGSGNIFFSFSKFTSIPNGSTTSDFEVPNNQISNPCGDFSSVFFRISNNSPIVYH